MRRFLWMCSLVLLVGPAGCKGPTCESACEKAFNTCNLTQLSPETALQPQIDACIAACRADLRDYATESRAIGWTACVEDFECDPSDPEIGIDLCFACEAGYYIGQSGGSACNAADEASRPPWR